MYFQEKPRPTIKQNVSHFYPSNNQQKINDRISIVKKELIIQTENCTCDFDYSEFYKVLKLSEKSKGITKTSNSIKFLKRQLHKLIILPLTLPL